MNINYIIFGILLAAFVLTVFFVYYYKYQDAFQNFAMCNKKSNITFLSDEEVRAFLRNDKDKYVQNMSKYDLYARQATTGLEYINRISQCNKNEMLLDQNDIENLSKCAAYADKFLENYTYKSVIQGKYIAGISWKIAIVCDEYEDGFPHTREDVIFLTRKRIKVNQEALTSLLIHEKIHIFQRYNPQQMEFLLGSTGYTHVAYTNNPKYNSFVRSNPDTNDKVYSFKGKEFVFLYKSDKPIGINDVDNSNSIEHPYEEMAYDIANDYLRLHMKRVMQHVM